MRKLAVAALLVSTLLVAPAFAVDEGTRDMHGGTQAAQMWKGLNLTAAQRQQVKDLRAQDQTKMAEAAKRARTEMKAFMDLFGDAKADDARLRAQHDKVTAAANDAMKLHLDHMLAVRAILTPEQRKKFAAQRMKRHAMGMMDCPMCGAHEGDEE